MAASVKASVSLVDPRFVDYCVECDKILADYETNTHGAANDRAFRASLDQAIKILHEEKNLDGFLGMWADYVDERVLAPAGYSPAVRLEYFVALATEIPFRLTRGKANDFSYFHNPDFKCPIKNNPATINALRQFTFGVFRRILFVPTVTWSSYEVVPPSVDLLHCAIYGVYSSYREPDVTHAQFMAYVRSCVELSKLKRSPSSLVVTQVAQQRAVAQPMVRTSSSAVTQRMDDKSEAVAVAPQPLDRKSSSAATQILAHYQSVTTGLSIVDAPTSAPVTMSDEAKRLQGIEKLRLENEFWEQRMAVMKDDDNDANSQESTLTRTIEFVPPILNPASSGTTIRTNNIDETDEPNSQDTVQQQRDIEVVSPILGVCDACGKGDFGQCICD